jgi:membrane protein DedA with SNARE-associated domain
VAHVPDIAGVLWTIAFVALGWALLDVREVFHQAGESRTGIALLAAAVAVLHLATAAVAGRLAVRARRVDMGSARRPGTMPA